MRSIGSGFVADGGEAPRTLVPRVPEGMCHRNDLWVKIHPGPDRFRRYAGFVMTRHPTGDTRGLDSHRHMVAVFTPVHS